jgi:hypothetical protein
MMLDVPDVSEMSNAVLAGTEGANLRALKNVHFCPIPASGLNFNPQNTKCIPMVTIFVFLDLERN